MYKNTAFYKNFKKFYSQKGRFVRLHPQKKVYIPFSIVDVGTYVWDDLRSVYFNTPDKEKIERKYKFSFSEIYPHVLNFTDFFIRAAKVYSDYEISKKLLIFVFKKFASNKKYYNFVNIFISLLFYIKEHYPYYFNRHFCIFTDINFEFKRLSFYNIIADKETRDNIDRILNQMLVKGYQILRSDQQIKTKEDYLCRAFASAIDDIIKSEIFLEEVETFLIDNEFDVFENFKFCIFNFRDILEFSIIYT